MKNIQKQMKFVIVWGGNSKLRGEFPPLKPLKKNTDHNHINNLMMKCVGKRFPILSSSQANHRM